jgi:hypothetical protein
MINNHNLRVLSIRASQPKKKNRTAMNINICLHSSSPYVNPNMFKRNGSNACPLVILLKNRSEEYLIGVIEEMIFTKKLLWPILINCPAPRVVSDMYRITEVRAS